MNRPQVLGVYRTKDAATKALDHPRDPYYRRLRAQVAWVGKHSPDPERPWGLVVPAVERKGKGDG